MKRQFIAGAVCPRCGELDKIVVVSEGPASYRECVRCGFQDDRPEAVVRAPTEVATRVTRASARRLDVQAEPIKMTDAADLKKPTAVKPD